MKRKITVQFQLTSTHISKQLPPKNCSEFVRLSEDSHAAFDFHHTRLLRLVLILRSRASILLIGTFGLKFKFKLQLVPLICVYLSFIRFSPVRSYFKFTHVS